MNLENIEMKKQFQEKYQLAQNKLFEMDSVYLKKLEESYREKEDF